MKEFRVWCPEEGITEEDAEVITLDIGDPSWAAELWVERFDVENHSIATCGGDLTVHVRSPSGRTYVYRVTGEVVPEYNALEVTSHG